MLLVRPNRVVSTFLSGDVKTYVNPLKYLILTVATLLIIDWSESFITGDPDGISDMMEIQIYGASFLFSIYLIIANKLFWRQYKWVEHLIISPYLAIQLFLIAIIFFIPASLLFEWGYVDSKDDLAGYPFIIVGIYYFYYNLSVFHERKILTFFKSILILLIGFTILTIGFVMLDLVPPVEV